MKKVLLSSIIILFTCHLTTAQGYLGKLKKAYGLGPKKGETTKAEQKIFNDNPEIMSAITGTIAIVPNTVNRLEDVFSISNGKLSSKGLILEEKPTLNFWELEKYTLCMIEDGANLFMQSNQRGGYVLNKNKVGGNISFQASNGTSKVFCGKYSGEYNGMGSIHNQKGALTYVFNADNYYRDDHTYKSSVVRFELMNYYKANGKFPESLDCKIEFTSKTGKTPISKEFQLVGFDDEQKMIDHIAKECWFSTKQRINDLMFLTQNEIDQMVTKIQKQDEDYVHMILYNVHGNYDSWAIRKLDSKWVEVNFMMANKDYSKFYKVPAIIKYSWGSGGYNGKPSITVAGGKYIYRQEAVWVMDRFGIDHQFIVNK
ncbi:hypothetical protein [Sediminitomix flava]|nr:hypothetical protein [Sediminitomix flava]